MMLMCMFGLLMREDRSLVLNLNVLKTVVLVALDQKQMGVRSGTVGHAISLDSHLLDMVRLAFNIPFQQTFSPSFMRSRLREFCFQL